MTTPHLYRLPAGGRNTAAGLFVNVVLAVLELMLGAIWAGTQYVAWQLGYHPHLGTPLLTILPQYGGMLLIAAVAFAIAAGWCFTSARLRRYVTVPIVVTVLLLTLWWGPLYAPLNYFLWRWHFGAVHGTEAIGDTALVRPYPADVKDAQNIADILVDPNGDGLLDHWDLTAHHLLVGVLLHVLYAELDKTLHGCLTLLTDPTRPIENTLSTMLRTPHDPTGAWKWTDASGKPTQTHPTVAEAAQALLNKSENERSSVVSSAVKLLTLYHDPVVTANTSTCDFALRDLMHAEQPVSLYLTTPPSEISRTRSLMRLVLHQVGRRLTESMPFAEGQHVADYRHRLLLMLDEFPALGRLDFFQTTLSFLAGYGIKAYLLVQDLTPLSAAYSRDESIISPLSRRLIDLGFGLATLSFIGVNGRQVMGEVMAYRAQYGAQWPAQWLRDHGQAEWATVWEEYAAVADQPFLPVTEDEDSAVHRVNTILVGDGAMPRSSTRPVAGGAHV